MIWVQQNLHLLIVAGLITLAVVMALTVLTVAIRRISQAPKFALWIDEVFSDENGKGSNQRLSRFLALVAFEAGWVYAIYALIEKAQYTSVVGLFVTHAALITGFYGLNVVDNATKTPPVKPFPDLPKPGP